jgi:hypothetical protein
VVESGKLEIGDARKLELRFLRFDVTNFEKRLTREDILALPNDVRERLWLFDLDLSSGPNTPQLLDNALSAIRALDPDELPQAARNMQALMQMTPDDANLKGTVLERLIELAPLLGVAPEQVLADLFEINVEDPFLDDAIMAQVILDQVIDTHPRSRTRLGTRTRENPEGIYAVPPGKLAVTLGDVASDFASFGDRYGPYAEDGVEHPGFVVGKTLANVLTEDFALSVRANANALPYKGVDLTTGSTASVNSVRSQIEALFDFDDPNWLGIEGLVEGVPLLESLTLRIVEADRFYTGGRSPVPQGIGASDGWTLPPWTLERVLLGAAQRAFVDLESFVAYTPPGRERAIFEASVQKGWQNIVVQGGLGSPPPASYVWDLLLEVGQVRLHDGGLKEGEADVELSLRDIPLGTDTATLTERMRDNLREDPYALLDIAEQIIDTTEGAADFYYYRASPGNVPTLQGDWLFFVNQDDLDVDADGQPTRSYDYDKPGFYADEALTEKLSDKRVLDGDESHEKVRIEDDMVLYLADDDGAVFTIGIGNKPSPNRRNITVKRVR